MGRRFSDHTGRNVSERREGLETSNAEANPPPLGEGRRPVEESNESTAGFRRGNGVGTCGRWKT